MTGISIEAPRKRSSLFGAPDRHPKGQGASAARRAKRVARVRDERRQASTSRRVRRCDLPNRTRLIAESGRPIVFRRSSCKRWLRDGRLRHEHTARPAHRRSHAVGPAGLRRSSSQTLHRLYRRNKGQRRCAPPRAVHRCDRGCRR
jgi:hypothetical protein